MKGIILAGGLGTRLYPITLGISKHLLPIYNKPMIYYPLVTLMQADIRDIALITTPEDYPLFNKILGDGQQWGINIQYLIQPNPEGIAQAFIIAKDFLQNDKCCLILGDNIFFGEGLEQQMIQAQKAPGATIFAYHVSDPERYGVIFLDDNKVPLYIKEKPANPNSSLAITGLYFYDNDVISFAENLKPSARGELEITDINNIYLKAKRLNVNIFGRGIAWLDTGTHQSLLEASQFVHALETRQGVKICAPEETAWQKGWINDDQLIQQSKHFDKSDYGPYLRSLIKQDR
ncbi:glucose-1-phosphate thymidylyltransferase RfbA [Zooshikella sp. RANM57]|uniref:glucose-1-phosphate thymidylyltransferase RfbA n=1 Tax=Zooshikella sp. RANM57 TaxID=3425863 RepID=UPI003D701572